MFLNSTFHHCFYSTVVHGPEEALGKDIIDYIFFFVYLPVPYS